VGDQPGRVYDPLPRTLARCSYTPASTGRVAGVEIRSTLLLPAALGILLGLSLVRAPAVFAGSVLLVAGAIVVVVTSRCLTRGLAAADRRREQMLALVLLGTHMVLGLMINASRTLTNYIGPDAGGYHRDAIQLLAHWRGQQVAPMLAGGKEGFYYGLAWLYGLFGPHKAAGLAVIATCAALILPITADTTRRLFGSGRDRPLGLILLVLPAYVVWTSHLLREAPIVLCIVISVNCAVRLSERATLSTLLVTGVTSGVLLTLRANVAFVLLGALVVGIALGRRHLIHGFSTAAVVVGVVAILVLAGGLGLRGYRLASQANLQQVSDLRGDLATTANSGYQDEADVSTTKGAANYLVSGLPTFFLGPFPWQIGSSREVPGMIEAWTLWLLIPALVRGLRRSKALARRQTFILLVPALALALVLTLLTGNFGIIVRERLQVLVVLLPIVALGWVRDPKRLLHGQLEQPSAATEPTDQQRVPAGPTPSPWLRRATR